MPNGRTEGEIMTSGLAKNKSVHTSQSVNPFLFADMSQSTNFKSLKCAIDCDHKCVESGPCGNTVNIDIKLT